VGNSVQGIGGSGMKIYLDVAQRQMVIEALEAYNADVEDEIEEQCIVGTLEDSLLESIAKRQQLALYLRQFDPAMEKA
jgi:hypothetical protein